MNPKQAQQKHKEKSRLPSMKQKSKIPATYKQTNTPQKSGVVSVQDEIPSMEGRIILQLAVPVVGVSQS